MDTVDQQEGREYYLPAAFLKASLVFQGPHNILFWRAVSKEEPPWQVYQAYGEELHHKPYTVTRPCRHMKKKAACTSEVVWKAEVEASLGRIAMSMPMSQLLSNFLSKLNSKWMPMSEHMSKFELHQTGGHAYGRGQAKGSLPHASGHSLCMLVPTSRCTAVTELEPTPAAEHEPTPELTPTPKLLPELLPVLLLVPKMVNDSLLGI